MVKIIKVSIDNETLTVNLEDGRTISMPIGWNPRLPHGTPTEREHFQIGGAGFGIYWSNLNKVLGLCNFVSVN